ncbi:hypothetical protein FZEAL_151 [Fusarium zealandicum]|uniref:Uncharacterized protein n=1 Tax=Fusarium zealandicum TaxID=1053134 RepID=A0A8H4XR60_9HYPO|nr:hypothetical protein FZEAL_151 [Fusarium zealandicum]
MASAQQSHANQRYPAIIDPRDMEYPTKARVNNSSISPSTFILAPALASVSDIGPENHLRLLGVFSHRTPRVDLGSRGQILAHLHSALHVLQ